MLTRFKIPIIAALVILVGMAIFFFRTQQQPPQKSTVFGPKITNYVRGKYTIRTSLTEKDFSFPASGKLLSLDVGPAFSKEQAKTYAARLGFNEEPKEALDITEGTTYIWKNAEAALVIYSKSRKIKYGLQFPTQTINKQLSNEAIVKIAQELLTDKVLKDTVLEFMNINFLRAENRGQEGLYSTSKDKASVYQVNFSPIPGKKILTLDPQSSPDFVWVLPDGNVFKFQTTVFATLKEGETDYPLKNFEQFKNGLEKAVVVSLDDGNLHLPDLAQGSLKEIVIDKVELIYLLDNVKSPTLQPVFLLTGEAQIQDRPTAASVQLYLPALANIQP